MMHCLGSCPTEQRINYKPGTHREFPMRTRIVVVWPRKKLLLHTILQDHQCIKVQLQFEWTGSQHSLCPGRFLTCMQLKSSGQSSLRSRIQKTGCYLQILNGACDAPTYHTRKMNYSTAPELFTVPDTNL